MATATAKKSTALALGSDVSSSSLADRLLDVSAQLDDLREQRGVAYLDGKPFDTSQIRALEEEFETLRNAEAEAVRRERIEAEMAQERRRQEVRKHIADTEPKRLEAIMAAETAATALVVALKDIETFSQELDTSLSKLGVRCADLSPDSVKTRFSNRLSAAMRPILTRGWREYGDIVFPNPFDSWMREWVPAEMQLIAPVIAKIQDTGKDNSND